MKVLIINGHPRKGSFSEALTEAYAEGAKAAGTEVNILVLANLKFNLHVTERSPRQQLHEHDILAAQQMISAADHLVFIYPTWWGTMPALLKGFFDRVLTPGFAFEEIEGGITGYKKLLKGKSADIITTMDTPLLVNQLVNKSPGNNAVKTATLQFCGIDPVNVLNFAPLKNADENKRKSWIEKVKRQGLKLKHGRVTAWQQFRMKTFSWLKAIRFQFYPMTLIAYASGAFAADYMGYGFNRGIFWLGFLWLFLVELSTVFSNDFFDYKSDEHNRYFGPFTGGSRVIVEKELSFEELKKAIFLSLALSVFVLVLLSSLISGAALPLVVTCLIVYLAAVGYTVPPLKLSYRGLGEIDVAFTHSLAVIVCGYIFQGGNLADRMPWLIGLPLFPGVLPSIILAGIPDYDADKLALKKTLAVRLGKKSAASLAMILSIIAAAMLIIFKELHFAGSAYSNLVYVVVPHASLLCYKIYQYIKDPLAPARIDSLLVIALTYLVWFGLIPLINLS